jgi:hypothetical protein
MRAPAAQLPPPALPSRSAGARRSEGSAQRGSRERHGPACFSHGTARQAWAYRASSEHLKIAGHQVPRGEGADGIHNADQLNLFATNGGVAGSS